MLDVAVCCLLFAVVGFGRRGVGIGRGLVMDDG